MGDWSQTVEDREKGELIGFVGHNEPTDSGKRFVAPSDQPLTDVRRVAVKNTESAGIDVADAPALDSDPSEVQSGAGTVASTGGDDGRVSASSQSDGDDEGQHAANETRQHPDHVDHRSDKN